MSAPDAQGVIFDGKIRDLSKTAQEFHAKVVSIKGMLPAYDSYAHTTFAREWDRIFDIYAATINGSQVSATKLACLIKDYAMVANSKDVDADELVDEFRSKLDTLNGFDGFSTASDSLTGLRTEILNLISQVEMSTTLVDRIDADNRRTMDPTASAQAHPTQADDREKQSKGDSATGTNTAEPSKSRCILWNKIRAAVNKSGAAPSNANAKLDFANLADSVNRATAQEKARIRASPEALVVEIQKSEKIIGVACSQHSIFNHVVSVLRQDIQAMQNASEAVVSKSEPDAQVKLVRLQARVAATAPTWNKAVQALEEWSKLSTGRKPSKPYPSTAASL